MIEALPHACLIKVVVAIWAIWTARRKAIHEGILQSPHATHSFVNSFISELETFKFAMRAPVQQGSSSNRRADPGYVWKAPGVGVAKIHVDGGLSRDGKGGASATLYRDHEGDYLDSCNGF